ncbi:RimK/LysX family protein [Methanogenium organophilum]|uniref:RimK/LysX family protein n=1 Tax=Methanogenium organophilum TaxID=2199 RepID=A0A9X9S388_METOG|nr:RimK/LysX family protein [Methanogenium organophilum]WAI01094.1 RimK/LysX family protein [Methanogenium organophilum]
MEPADLLRDLTFLKAEKDLAARFSLSPEALLPIIFSIRYGGDWSYASENLSTISVMKKTSVYDEETKLGSSLEEIYLLVNPAIQESEGTVHRLEKCGNQPARLLVERPFRVRARADRILKMTIDPLAGEIRIKGLSKKEISFEGSPAYGFAHEIEHLEKKEITGKDLSELRFV